MGDDGLLGLAHFLLGVSHILLELGVISFEVIVIKGIDSSRYFGVGNLSKAPEDTKQTSRIEVRTTAQR